MLWHTPLPDLGMFGGYHGARATAWDGKEDPYTGKGGHVYVGTCGGSGSGNVVFVLNGDTGEVDSHVIISDLSCAYGGAMDPQGNFWIYNSGPMSLIKVEAESLFWEMVPISCAYGITVDGQGRVWTGGYGSGSGTCVSRYDPATGIEDTISITGGSFLRGLAVGTEKSAGYVWASDSPGTLYQIDQESMEVVGSYVMGNGIDMIGAAVDYEGYVWTVAQMSSSAFKFDPDTETFATFSTLQGPYTYSDMTGVQLRNVVPVN
jgi:streptogramin lyase